MYLISVFAPILNFLILALFGRFLGRDNIFYITVFFISLCFLGSSYIFFEVSLSNSSCLIDIGSWLTVGFLNIKWSFFFDTLTSVMLFVISFISLLVHVYSFDYMKHDTHLIRFISYLSLFTFFMIMLVTSANFLQFFLGWEGVGITSYLLINFWFTRMQANKSAIKAILVNKVGDIALIIAVCIIYVFFKTLDFSVFFCLLPLFSSVTYTFLFIDFDLLTIICFFLFIGVVAKSAQLGLHMWLPDAMEGPTPVSALIHAATMVTAGVFLLLRCSPLFNYSISMLLVVTVCGALTSIFAALVGISQIDIKKIIAFSTCSQLGYMVFSCGLSSYSSSLFHLTNHAFFKALLFLSAGVIIHALQDEQDLRRMGGLVNLLPFTYCVMMIGTFAIIGFPFLSGFYSKDVILELSFANLNYKWEAIFAFLIGIFTAAFTAMYSFKLVILVFLRPSNVVSGKLFFIEEASLLLALPLFVLCFFSIFSGFIFKDMFVGLGSHFWNNSLNLNSTILFSEFLLNDFVDFDFIYMSFTHFAFYLFNIYCKFIPLLFTFGGVFIIFLYYFKVYHHLNSLNDYLLYIYGWRDKPEMYYFSYKKFYIDYILNRFLVNFFFRIGYNDTFKLIDRGLLESVDPKSITQYVTLFSNNIQFLQTGLFVHYLHYIFSMLILFLFFLFFSYNVVVFGFVLLVLYLEKQFNDSVVYEW